MSKIIEDNIEQAFNCFKDGDFDGAILKLKKVINLNDKNTISDAYSLMGQSYFKKGDYGEAQKCFEILVKDEITTPSDWFNLCTAATMNQNIILGKKAFDKTIEITLEKQGDNNLGNVILYIFYYMQCLRDVEEFDKAFEQLEKLTDFYSKFTVIDLTQMVLTTGIPNIPPFEAIIERSKMILEHIGKEKADKWFDDFTKNLDAKDKNILKTLDLS